MKKIVILCLTTLITLVGYAQMGHISIEIKNIKSPNDGPVVLMLFQSEDGFPIETNKASYLHIIHDVGKVVKHVFRDIPHGVYAVAIFQDKNENNKIDRNWMGMPNEPVGASNQSRLGKPKFSRSRFDHSGAQKNIQLEFIND